MILWRLSGLPFLGVVSWMVATGNSPVDLGPILNIGLVGTLAVLFGYGWMKGKIHSGLEFDRIVAENDKWREMAPEMTAALVSSTEALREATAVQRQVSILLEVQRQTRP